jgi:hypothetical protein
MNNPVYTEHKSVTTLNGARRVAGMGDELWYKVKDWGTRRKDAAGKYKCRWRIILKRVWNKLCTEFNGVYILCHNNIIRCRMFAKRICECGNEPPTIQHSPSEKLIGLQLVKEFPAFYRTRRFITAFTSAHHLPLSWASPIQSISPLSTSWRSILIFTSRLYLGLPSGLFP